MRVLFDHCGTLLQSLEEAANLLPKPSSPGKPAPIGGKQANQFLALVDRKHIIFRSGKSSCMSDAVDEESFDVRFQFLKDRIGIFDIPPSLEWQQGLGRAGGAGIEGNYSGVRRTLKKESHADGHHQALPLAIGKMKICEGQHPPRHTLVLCSHATK